MLLLVTIQLSQFIVQIVKSVVLSYVSIAQYNRSQLLVIVQGNASSFVNGSVRRPFETNVIGFSQICSVFYGVVIYVNLVLISTA